MHKLRIHLLVWRTPLPGVSSTAVGKALHGGDGAASGFSIGAASPLVRVAPLLHKAAGTR